jgi:hypothetical protein
VWRSLGRRRDEATIRILLKARLMPRSTRSSASPSISPSRSRSRTPSRRTESRTRPLTIVAQDPSIVRDGRILTATVDVPAEALAAGPWGHRVQIIDYDASTDTLYKPLNATAHGTGGQFLDPYANAADRTILRDPNFHAQNAYAIVMRTLARFEFALGRRVSWGFGSHQVKVAPHAFADANAFYSERDEALVFGYFPGHDGALVFSCLSHDVVAHETTHALLDGLRTRFTDPSSPDQAAFHEGYADVVALLSVFSLTGIVEYLIDYSGKRRDTKRDRRVIARKYVDHEQLRESIVFGLAEQMGSELSGVRGQPLRRSLALSRSPRHYRDDPDFLEPHRRGEILVAAVLNAFISIWSHRLETLGDVVPGHLDRRRVVEEGAAAADRLLTMVIRALDYTPPVRIEFGDFLSAALTADAELQLDDSKYHLREHLRESFELFGITAASRGTATEPGTWRAAKALKLSFGRTHFESLTRDPDEVFWFIWENRRALEVFDGAYGRVLSVRPCLRIAPDGFALRETVAEFYQVIKVSAAELPRYGLRAPNGMPRSTVVSLYGGNALVFDEYGQLKYNIHNNISDSVRQQRRLDYLWRYGFFNAEQVTTNRFAELHLRRAMGATLERATGEEW